MVTTVPAQHAIDDFLAQPRIAVAGVSREAATERWSPAHCDGTLLDAPRVQAIVADRGYAVVRGQPRHTDVIPMATRASGSRLYRVDPARAPGPARGGVDAVVIATAPEAAESIARECKELGITRVWMHRSFGAGSVSQEAHEYCRANGIASIAGGCPLMYGRPSDGGHRMMRWMLGLFGKLPREA